MAQTSIELGKADQLKVLFSYPNLPDQHPEPTLDETILHWVGQSLCRDGLKKEMASLRVEDGQYTLEIDGPSDAECDAYATRYPKILEYGWTAWTGPVKQIMGRKVWSTDDVCRPMWDPNGTGKWRFFLTLGVGIANHRSLQFFHYPPARLLDPLCDSMKDPVTYRCRDLLEANGVHRQDTHLYETRINSTPIAAPDDQGTNSTPPADPVWGGLIPIGYFRQFERDMIGTLIKPHDDVRGYTIPMTAYGKDPRQRFGGMFLNALDAMVIEVLKGHKTPVLGSNHPYLFYYMAQAKDGAGEVGSGKMLSGQEIMDACVELQQVDLSVVRWQVEMAKNPSQDPWKMIADCQAYWTAPARQELVKKLVLRHGSLEYKTPEGLDFWFADDQGLGDPKDECGTS